VIQIEIQTPEKNSTSAFKTCLIATVTQGNLAMEKGVTLSTVPVLTLKDVPDRERDYEDYAYPDFTKKFAPGAFKPNERRVKG
jgi:hypothetical protein